MKRFASIFMDLLLAASVLSGCWSNRLELCLEMAEENRLQLEKALSRFKGDSVRTAAVRYLIENMPGKFTVNDASVSGNQPYYDALIAYRAKQGGLGVTGLYDVIDSLDALHGKPTVQAKYDNDLRTLSADFLADRVDEAVSAWEKASWKSAVNFKDFCRYILPYRVYECRWEGADAMMRKRFAHLSGDTSDYLVVGEKIRSEMGASFRQDGTFFREHPYMSPTRFENTLRVEAGVCYDFNAAVVTALRSVGIPAAINTVPYWGNSNASHFWTEIIGTPVKGLYDNTQQDFHSIDDELVNDTFWFKDGIITDTTGIPEEVDLRKCRTVPKIYRQGYEICPSSLALRAEEDIPDFFRDMTLEDVTSRMVVTRDVRVRVPKIPGVGRKRFVYLCVYNPDSFNWVPVSWAEIKRGRGMFKAMGINVLYMAALFHEGAVVPFGDPFVLTADGEMRRMRADTGHPESAVFFSKVPLRTNFAYYAMLMRGDRIQVANRADHADTVTVHSIDEIPYYMQEAELKDCPPARYAIYQTSRSILKFVAELEFWGEDAEGNEVKLEGKEIGNPCYSTSPLHDAFDGNRETFAYLNKFDLKTDWIGLDFGEPKKIRKIRFCPRNDDNAIVPGEEYELYFWDNGWQSLGMQTGGADCRLRYDNVPRGALLRIHNHTRGKENRPFMLEGGRQVWW